MPITLPTEVKLQIVKHYIDLVVEDAGFIPTELRDIYKRAMRTRASIKDYYNKRSEACLSSIEALLTAIPELTIDTYNLLYRARALERTGYSRMKETRRNYHGRGILEHGWNSFEKDTLTLQRFHLTVTVLARVLRGWTGLEERIGIRAGTSMRAWYNTQYRTLRNQKKKTRQDRHSTQLLP